jgi:uncharacterized protein
MGAVTKIEWCDHTFNPWWGCTQVSPLCDRCYAMMLDIRWPAVLHQIGHTGPLCRSEPGRPIPYLDDVSLDFPELVVVGGHVGFPWMDEVLSLARKYPNFYVDTSAYTVARLPPQLLAYMKREGAGRVLFGTNWPMISPKHCLAALDDLGLDDRARELFLQGAARKVFRLAA